MQRSPNEDGGNALTRCAVSLTQTKKKTRDNKERLVDLVRDCVDECVLASRRCCHDCVLTPPRFAAAYVFRYENMRNATLKELRDKLHGTAR